jgi:hypothetical protein
VHPECKTSIHSFSFPRGPGVGPISALRHVTPNLCVCNWCNMWVTYCILVHSGLKMLTHYFSCSGGPDADPTKSVMRHILLNFCFASDVIYRSRCAFWCIRVVKCRHTTFHSQVGLVWFLQESPMTRYAKLVFL